jgi:hypothetical protein
MRARFFLLSGLPILALILFATPSPRAQSAADPGAPVPPVRYESITAGTKSYRPVDPLPWPDVNRRVAPPGEGDRGKDGASPGSKNAPTPEGAQPRSRGSGGP